ncbi:efflux RND transporter periplasmic adaptor subunit [Limibaculum sp. M0105]|uniref:Efflux RND transporter periplasmic adaptor subunit n=1 Tax=Thermohalobaculum xanthum TaxID=2753746 RepID=A0A8J7SBR0_9RHOB|nr:efflux RND transporter periplasmic adaptor subunit [Thermohalobaculum xanthum]MBK0397816.1 efflux RND transporter periplasmic adaptor subunit [Thermohalobaculum xanthum]
MRVAPLILALGLAAGLAWWFVPHVSGRQDSAGAQDATATAEQATTRAGSPASADAPSPGAPSPGAVPVMIMEISAEPTIDRITLRGRTEANRNVVVRAETPGRVISEPLRAGTRVDDGTLLCRLEPGARQAQVAEAEAALAEAQVEADAATQLSQKGFTAETTRVARLAALQRAEAALDLVRLDIARLEIRAPFAGILESDTAEFGARLGIGDACATVIDLSEVKVTGYVSEQDVDRLSVGQPVTVRLISGAVHEGAIGFIGSMADESTRTYRVEARLPNADGSIRDGMTAEIGVELPAERAHRIPQAALTLDDEGRLGVRLADDSTARFLPVRIVREDTGGVWVTGLPETARVIVVGQEFVRDGRPILSTPVSWDDLG